MLIQKLLKLFVGQLIELDNNDNAAISGNGQYMCLNSFRENQRNKTRIL